VHNFPLYVYLFSLRIAGYNVPITWRNNCIYATLGSCYFVWMAVWYAHSRPQHVEKINKHTKKNCAPSWLYLQDYTGMHGQ